MIALHELLVCVRDESAPVCMDAGCKIGFGAFQRRVASCASHLACIDGARVALSIDDPFDFACALFAVLAVGRLAVIPASAAPAYLASLRGAYDVLLTDDDMAALPLVSAPGVDAKPSARWTAIDRFAPLTLYTSGSTGMPKAVDKTLAQFDAEVRTLEAQWGAALGNATILASVPHRHIYGLLFRLFWPLAAGRAFDRSTALEPQQLQARLACCTRAAVVSSPAQLARWPALPGFDALSPAPRLFFSSGAPLAADVADVFTKVFGEAPVEVYGSTETGGIAWRQQHASANWQALPGIALARDADSALVVRSAHLGHDNPHRTDDAVELDGHGRFRLRGRLDRVVKLDGKRVALPEIETWLAAHPYVGEAAATVVAGTSRERLGALVALTEAGRAALLDGGRIALVRTLRTHLAGYVDAIVLPRRWRFCSALPFDARGKLPATVVTAAFGPRASGVEVLAELHHKEASHYDLRVPRGLVHFAGHFPGLPILPGVVQIEWAFELACARIDGVRRMASLDRLKFMAPVPPGAILRLALEHDAERRRVRFSFRLGAREAASGVIVYREPA